MLSEDRTPENTLCFEVDHAMQDHHLYDRYSPAYIPHHHDAKSERWFIFHKDRLLTRLDSKGPQIPDRTILAALPGSPAYPHYLGCLDEDDCYCLSLDEAIDLPEGFDFCQLRALGEQIDTDIFLLAGRASQILHWDRMSRFCGRCGAPTRMKDDERAKQCDHCGNIIYPRISPAIIIAITRGNQILLAHNKNFRNNMYSLIAGFMEPGENFDDTARREVFEEVGIRIRNLRYFASQPWPFPDSLMIGLWGEYESGEITVDGVEIEHAAWFSRDHLPVIPSEISIAGRMIRRFAADVRD